MVSLALMLFLIMDPFGNLVTLNALLANQTPRRRCVILLRESLIATVLLLLAAVVGGWFLRSLGLEAHALGISGGIVLFLIALGMVFPSRRIIEDSIADDPLIVPIAMPLIAGPSALSMVILFAERMPLVSVCAAITIASAGSAILLAASPVFYQRLGKRGAAALERLIGMLLVIISVQMILNGVDAYLKARGIGS
jgi:multiple antibiotic resistance protein